MNKFYIGETVKFVAIVDNSPSSVTLTVIDPRNKEKITKVTMDEESDGIWVYYYNSVETDISGVYVFRVEAINGLGNSIEEYSLELFSQR